MHKHKIILIGAGSVKFIQGLLADLIQSSSPWEIGLVDIDPQALETAKGLALGGSLKNAIVLDEDKVINKEGLRFPDEFVKHKVLDAIGDLFLLGMPIIGHFKAYKSGHKLNNLLLRELLAHKECWRIVNYFNGVAVEDAGLSRSSERAFDVAAAG